MRLFRPREYYRPKNLGEATQVLSRLGVKAGLIAGGTDLLVNKPPRVECLVDVSGLNLDYIRENEGGIDIGAATTISSLESSPVLSSEPYRLISEAASMIATPTIRNMATVGGNICNASPAADLLPAFMVLDSIVKIAGLNGNRTLPIAEFIKNVNKTVLTEDELLVEVHVPPSSRKCGTAFAKLRHHQTSIDIAIVNVATRLTCSSDDVCEDAKIALGAVAATPIYARRAERLLIGKKIDAGLVKRAAEIASEESEPIDDIRASAGYRRRMVRVLVSRALEDSVRRCGYVRSNN